jgi:hypothetical protein
VWSEAGHVLAEQIMMAVACSCPRKKIANGLLMHRYFFIVLQIVKGLKKVDDARTWLQ